MEANIEVTPSSPGTKRPQVLTLLSRLLDTILVPILAVFSALVIGGLIIVITDATVYVAFREEGVIGGLAMAWQVMATAYGAMFSGSLGDASAISESLVASTPFIFAGLAVALGFRGGLFNIGAEGQLLVAAGVSVVIGNSIQLPAIIHLPLALLGGMIGGAIYGSVPGYLKAKTGAHEVINTIMMNWIAFLFFSWAFTGILRREGGDAPVTDEIFSSAYLPRFFAGDRFHWEFFLLLAVVIGAGWFLFVARRNYKVTGVMIGAMVISGGLAWLISAYLPRFFEGTRFHWGFFLALLVAFGVWWLLFKTTLGFEIRTVGANPNAARYGGINITRITVLTMALSGGLAGLAGAGELLGLNHFLADGFSPGFGFDAIALALLGKSHPLGVVLAALLFGTLRNGATRMQSIASVPIDIISVIQALVIVFIAAPAIVRWIYRVRAKSDIESTTFTRGWGA